MSSPHTAPVELDAPAPKRRKHRRSWPQRLWIVTGLALVAGCLYGADYISDIEQTFGEVNRVTVAQGVLGEVGDVRFEPRNILVLGYTENAGIDRDDPLLWGRDEAKVTDTVMVVRVDPLQATAAVLSLPRDLGFNGTKINSLMAFGGPERIVRDIKANLDIEINNFVIVNFAGFRKIIDSIDGVPIYFPHPVRDLGSFFEAPQGCSILSGEQALNYVRSRKFEQQIDGRWKFGQSTDYERAERQRDFLILALDRVIAKGGRNPSTSRNLLKTAIESNSITLDQYLRPDDLLNLAKSLSDFRPEYLQRFQLPVAGSDFNGNSLMDRNAAAPILDVFRGNTPDLQPFQVGVSLYEARTKPESNVSRQLLDLKFKSASNRPWAFGTQPHTIIRYTSDERYAAGLLARYLDTLPYFEQIPGSKPTLRQDTLQLIVGDDYTGVRPEPRGEADTPLINRLLDASATGVVSAASLSGTKPVAAPAPTAASPASPGANPASSPPPAAAPPSSVAPSPTERETSGIIGLPPSGVTCTRFESPR